MQGFRPQNASPAPWVAGHKITPQDLWLFLKYGTLKIAAKKKHTVVCLFVTPQTPTPIQVCCHACCPQAGP